MQLVAWPRTHAAGDLQGDSMAAAVCRQRRLCCSCRAAPCSLLRPIHAVTRHVGPAAPLLAGAPRVAPCSRHAQRGVAAHAAEEEASISVPLEIRSAQGYQLAGFISDPTGASFDAAVTSYMKDLRKEQDAETAMSRAIAASETAEDWEKDPVLLQRMSMVREAERGGVLQELLYIICLRNLIFSTGCIFLSDLQQLQLGKGAIPETLVQLEDLLLRSSSSGSSDNTTGGDTPQQQQQQGEEAAEDSAPGLMTPAAADALSSYVANTFGPDLAASPPETPLTIDRVQAARLYGGFVEFGYFTGRLEALCQEQGVDLSGNSDAMIAHANTIPDETLAGFCAVESADGWYAAVRHIGGLFDLPPNRDPYDSLGLPFPCLATTLSTVQLEPAANVWEHFSPPGSAADLAARARDKQARGWNVDPSELEPSLPEADLLSFELGGFQRLLLEAGVFGFLLRRAEAQLQAGGYQLASLAARRECAGQPAM